MKKFKNNLKNVRDAKNITGIELAKMVGISHSMIYMIENGDRNPGIKLAKKIADALDRSIEEIFFDDQCHDMLPNR